MSSPLLYSGMNLGIDLGTSGVKALLTRDFEVLGRGSVPLGVHRGPDGAVEQDIEEIWTALCSAVSQALTGHPGEIVRAVGVSSQGGALQLLDREQHPVGPVISWMDSRGRTYDDAIMEEKGPVWMKAHTGHGFSTLSLGQIQRLREKGLLPEGFQVGYVGDIMVQRLCGHRAHDPGSLGLTMMGNPATGLPDREVLMMLGLSENKLPQVLPATTPAGALMEDAASVLGLRAGIPVSPAIHDQVAAAIGCGVKAEGDLMFGAGTAWVLLALSDRLPKPGLLESYEYRYPSDGLFAQVLSMVNGGSSLAWMMETLNVGNTDLNGLDALIKDIPPGADGLICWPFLVSKATVGEGTHRSGRIEGMRLHHKPAHFLRAVQEGLAFELRRHLEQFRTLGVGVNRLWMAGGMTRSSVVTQLIADVTGREILCVEEPEVSALGAAKVAAVLANPDLSLAELPAANLRVVSSGIQSETYPRIYKQYLEGCA